jgi:hypothetical protein
MSEPTDCVSERRGVRSGGGWSGGWEWQGAARKMPLRAFFLRHY